MRRVLLSRRPPAGASTDDPLRRDLASRMSAEDENRLWDRLPELIEEIRLRPGRRLAPSRSGRVWMRGVLRENARHGGVPFILPLRRRRPRRPEVLLLVDVSWSVARASGLFLALALSFLRSNRRARIFLFVDRPAETTDLLMRWAKRPRSRPFTSLLGEVRELNLDAPSDYGRVFYTISSQVHPASRETVLVVLGDGRVNRFDPLDWAFQELARRCRFVLWLVPEPAARWGTGDSALPRYLPHCDVAVETGDLEGLASGVREILRRL